jgi:hypothetical protein
LFSTRRSQGPESWLGSRGTEHIVVDGHSARARVEEQRLANADEGQRPAAVEAQ